MHTKILYTTMLAASMAAISNLASAATVPYGVFEHNKYSKDKSETISLLTGDHVSQLAKVEARDDASVLSVTADDLTITVTRSGDDGDDFSSGTWRYSGAASIDWLVIKYGRNFGVYHMTAGETSGVWNIAQLENFSKHDASGAKARKNRSVHYSSISHATAYTS